MKGFSVTCPHCNESGYMRLTLADCDELTCSQCDGETTVDQMREFVKEWTRFLAWVDRATSKE